ncbi:unnamed protein product, partial [Polarella glacialis]
PSYTATPRRPLPARIPLPGPGSYECSSKTMAKPPGKDPSWGFGTSRRPELVKVRNRDTDGTHSVKGASTSRAWSGCTPGPGSYESQSIVGEGPKYEFGARRPFPPKAPSPGPADHGGYYSIFA